MWGKRSAGWPHTATSRRTISYVKRYYAARRLVKESAASPDPGDGIPAALSGYAHIDPESGEHAGAVMTNRSGAAAFLGGTIIWALAAPAVAQPGFVGAATGVHLVRFSHHASQSPSLSDSDTSGDSRGWSVIGGGIIKRHGVLQAEYIRTGEILKDIPPTQYNPPCPSCGTSRTTVDYRAQQFAVLGGYTTGAWRRVSVAALGGIIFVRTSTHTVSTYTPAPGVIQPPPLPSESTDTQYVMGPAFGLDVPILAWRHIQVLPQFRIYQLSGSVSYSGGPGTLVTTASAGVRWTF